MDYKKFKGFPLIIVAILSCLVLIYQRGSDIYSVQYNHDDFRQVYLEGYSGDNSAMLYYVPEGEDTVKCFTKGPISLVADGDSTNYSVELQYAATDNSTVLKVFASDYISEDNSGGRVFVNEILDPEKSAVITSFVLDQPVDSLFVTLETKDDNLQIGRFNMRSNGYVFTDTYVLIFMVFVAAVIMLYLINCKRDFTQGFELNGQNIPAKNTMLRFVFIGVVAVLISSLPILDGGIILGHDTPFHLARIEGLARGLQSGQFPVRIHGGTINDYGYPNSLFYPELLLYVPAVLNLLGVSVYTSFKIYMVMVNALTLILSYIPFKKLTNSRYVGMTLAIVYLLAPYRIICAYYRCAVGEFTAMAFLPLVIYGLYAIIYGDKKDWGYLVAGATGVLQSHILTTEMTALFAVLFVILGIKNLFTNERRIVSLIYATVFTVLLNLWFLGPMLLMMLQLDLNILSRPSVTAGFAKYNISNLFGLTTTDVTGPHPIGFIIIFTVGLYCLYRIISVKNNKFFKPGDNLCWQLWIFTWASTAWFPWAYVEKIPFIGNIISSIQFPYRMLTIVQLCGVALLGILIILISDKKIYKAIICLVIVSFSIYSTLDFMEVTINDYNGKISSKSYYQNNIDNQLAVGQAEYLISGNNLDEMVADPPVLESDNETMTISGFEHWGTKMSFHYSMDMENGSKNNIILPVTYIPNYEIMINGEKISSDRNEDARIEFAVTSSEGDVTVKYVEPLTFRAFELMSIVSAGFMLVAYRKKLFMY